MGQLSLFLRNMEGEKLSFWCPGCKSPHTVFYGIGGWQWNGDANKPVISPSIFCTFPTWVPEVTHSNWEKWKKEPWKQEKQQVVCHSFIGCNGAAPGEIIFLLDCTHVLAGKTVPLFSWPSHKVEDGV